jgi:hypothetical protein
MADGQQSRIAQARERAGDAKRAIAEIDARRPSPPWRSWRR